MPAAVGQRRSAPARGRGLLRAARPATGEAARRSHRGRLLPSRRPAPAAVRQCRAGGAGRSRRWSSTSSAKAATGSAMPGEGAPGRRRSRRRRALPDDAASVRVPALPRLRRAGRPARDEGGDRRGSRAQGTRRRHQARARRHPRNRIPRAGAAADPRRARTGPARAAACCPRWRRWSMPATSRRRPARRLREAYRFLRRLENRLQMLRDAQTHALPEDALDRARIAHGLGYDDWAALRDALDVHRARVAAEFEALLAPRAPPRRTPMRSPATGARCPMTATRRALADAGFVDPAGADASLRDFARAPALRALSDARARAPGPGVAGAARPRPRRRRNPMRALRRLLPLLHNILRRASYLALLDEQPAALQRLVDVLARSALLAERLAAHPLLLDELLDVRVAGPLPGRDAMIAACNGALALDDTEAALHALNETRQALSFRIALATLDAAPVCAMTARGSWRGWPMRCSTVVLRLAAARDGAGARARSRDARLRGDRLRQPRRRGTGLRLGPRCRVPVRRRRRCAFRWRAPTRRGALVRTLRAEDRGAARHGHRCRPPVRRRRAPAPGWRQGPAGVEPGELRRLPARARVDLGTPGAGARARRGRRCGPARRIRAGARTQRWRGRAMPTHLRNDVRRDAREDARRAGSLRRAAASTSSRAKAGWSTSNSCCNTWCCAMRMHDRRCWPRATRRDCSTPLAPAAPSMRTTCADLRAAHATLLDAGLRCTLDRRPRIVVETDAIAAARAAIRAAAGSVGLVFSS